MKRFASLAAIPAIAALGFVAVPAAAGTSAGAHSGQSVHLTAAQGPRASQPCDPGYAAWADYYTGQYIVSHNVQNEDLNTSPSTWSCWHFPDSGTVGEEIYDEAGYCAEYHDGYVVSALCSGILAQGWDVEPGCYSGQYTVTSYWAESNGDIYTYMNESGGGTGDLINLAEPCYQADNWHPVAVV